MCKHGYIRTSNVHSLQHVILYAQRVKCSIQVIFTHEYTHLHLFYPCYSFHGSVHYRWRQSPPSPKFSSPSLSPSHSGGTSVSQCSHCHFVHSNGGQPKQDIGIVATFHHNKNFTSFILNRINNFM